MKDTGKEIKLTGQTLTTMARLYEMSRDTLKKNLRAIWDEVFPDPSRRNRLLLPRQVRRIIAHMDEL